MRRKHWNVLDSVTGLQQRLDDVVTPSLEYTSVSDRKELSQLYFSIFFIVSHQIIMSHFSTLSLHPESHVLDSESEVKEEIVSTN